MPPGFLLAMNAHVRQNRLINAMSLNFSHRRLSMLLEPCVLRPQYGMRMYFLPFPGPSTNANNASVKRRSDDHASVRATSSHFLSIRAIASSTTSLLTADPVAYEPCVLALYDEADKKSTGKKAACASSRDAAERRP